jgi:hypothetical protein
MNSTGTILTSCLATLFLASCERGELEVRSYNVAKSPVQKQQADPPAEAASDLKWDTPSGWTQAPTSGVRVASFTTFGKGDASITVLSGEAGGLVDNVNRWRKQIGLAPSNENEIRAQANPDKGAHGDFIWFRFLASNGDQAILAAIIAKPEKSIFVKLSGTQTVVDSNLQNFLKLTKSLRGADKP